MKCFGPHLMISGFADNRIDDLVHVHQFLERLVDEIGMTKITQPYVFPYSGLLPEDRGITGVVIIAESHISVHTFAEKGYVFLDIFSCKNFDVKAAIDFSTNWFGFKEGFEQKVENRGKQFPRPPQL